jgi:hypothetical protein
MSRGGYCDPAFDVERDAVRRIEEIERKLATSPAPWPGRSSTCGRAAWNAPTTT